MARIELPQRSLHLEYEAHGNAGDPPVVLIMGLGLQLVAWPPELIDALVAAGRRVIVFDNRDIGLSGCPPLPRYTPPRLAVLAYALHRRFRPPYRIGDMAADTLALADALGLERFDVVGVSLGGMVAQTLAARWPQRIRSLASIMSSAGPRTSRWPRPRLLWRFLRPPPKDADPAVRLDHFVTLLTMLGRLRDAGEIALLRERMALALQRAYNPAGSARQLLAVLADPDRSAEVSTIRCPTLILHGTADPLIEVSAARHLAHLLPQARLEIIEGLGHYLPQDKLPQIAAAAIEFLKGVDEQRIVRPLFPLSPLAGRGPG